MALFRMSAAFALLVAVAPEPTLRAVRQIVGMAEGAAPAETAAAGEAALSFCRSHPQACRDAVTQAAATVARPAKP
jgi:hypothetical protein